MEKIVNKVCNIVVSDNYKNFTSSVYEFNNKNQVKEYESDLEAIESLKAFKRKSKFLGGYIP